MCANCGGPVPRGHGCTSRENPRLHFCDVCAGIHQALCIGARMATILYETGNDATSWTGIKLGTIVHRSRPPRRRFAAARYRVQMLDGSLWWGTGPTANGTYMTLRPMKGA